MDDNLTMKLQEYLNPHEKIYWAGQPKKGLVFTLDDVSQIPFSLVWCGISIFWVIFASEFSVYFAMIGIPFVLIGLNMVFGRFIIDAIQRKNTIYAITGDRIIIVSGVFRKTVKSFNLSTLPDLEVDEKSDGSGTITIGPIIQLKTFGLGDSIKWESRIRATPMFYLIADVRSVHNKIIEVQKSPYTNSSYTKQFSITT